MFNIICWKLLSHSRHLQYVFHLLMLKGQKHSEKFKSEFLQEHNNYWDENTWYELRLGATTCEKFPVSLFTLLLFISSSAKWSTLSSFLLRQKLSAQESFDPCLLAHACLLGSCKWPINDFPTTIWSEPEVLNFRLLNPSITHKKTIDWRNLNKIYDFLHQHNNISGTFHWYTRPNGMNNKAHMEAKKVE